MPNRRPKSTAPAPDQTGGVNQTVDGNGEGSSNPTLNNRESQAPVNNRNDNDDNPIDDDDELALDAQIAAARDAEALLIADVNRLREKRREVDAINRRILDLQQEKNILREDLRLATSVDNSFADLAPASPRPLGSEDAGLEQESSFVPGPMDVDDFDDTIAPEPRRDELKMELDREKSYKVRAPDVYRGKNLDEWRTFTSSWEQVFRTQPWTYNRHSARVNTAASTLRDNAHDTWEAARRQSPPLCRIHWESFKAFLANMIAAPQTRQQEAFQGLRELQQLSGESVSELYTRMTSLEADQEPRPERDRVRTLNAALADREVKKQLASMLHGKEAKSVRHWIEQAQQAENLIHPRMKKGKTGDSSKGSSASKDPGTGSSNSQERRKKKEKSRLHRDNASGGNSGPSRSLPRSNSSADTVCYTCNQKGHYANSKRCSKYDEWAKQNPEKAKAQEDSRSLQRQVNQIVQEE